MKGTIILTSDARAYRGGYVVETRGIVDSPTAPKTTYIVHLGKVTEEEIKRWMDIVSYRMVIVIDKMPKLTKAIEAEVIIDKSLFAGKVNYKTAMDALFRWGDRTRVHKTFVGVPIPLALSFLRNNRIEEIELWRMLADVTFTLPKEYAEAVMCYGLKPSRTHVKWPKKNSKKDERPPMFRESDLYWRQIVHSDAGLRNDIRTNNIDKLPNEIHRRRESVYEWI